MNPLKKNNFPLTPCIIFFLHPLKNFNLHQTLSLSLSQTSTHNPSPHPLSLSLTTLGQARTHTHQSTTDHHHATTSPPCTLRRASASPSRLLPLSFSQTQGQDGKTEIDVGSLASVAVTNAFVLKLIVNIGEKLNAWVDYEVGSKTLEVRLSKLGEPRSSDPIISHRIDLFNLWDRRIVNLCSWLKERQAAWPFCGGKTLW